MRYAILEDEPMMAADLVADLAALRPQWSCMATLASLGQARAWLPGAQGIDLLFSDIQLGDGNCFELVAEWRPTVPVIFCTAYDQYALQAFDANGIGYLLKPYSPDRLRAAVEKLEALRGPTPDLGPLLQLLHARPAPQAPGRILVHHKDRIIPVPLAEVALFYLHHEQAMLLRMDGQRLPVQQTLGEVEQLAGAAFFRASRQHLVSRKAVRDASQHFGRKLLLNLSVPFDEQVTVSKEKVAAFLEWMAGG
jgi:two-component system response regulator LytT